MPITEMKNRLRGLLLMLFLTSVIEGAVAIPSNASEPCFSKIPDSAWTYRSDTSFRYPFPGSQPLSPFVSPPEVRDEINKFPQDYVYKIQRQISKNGGDWTAVEKVSGDVRLPLVPGDKYRNVITYEGRNCANRIVYMSDLIVTSGKTPTLAEYVSKYSYNFKQEGEFLAQLTESFPINFSVKEVQVGNKVDVITNPEFMNLYGKKDIKNTNVTIDFKDGCAKVLSGPYVNILPNTWRGSSMRSPQFEFIKSGVCKGEIYSYAMEGDLLPFLIGTIEYKVQGSKSTSKPGITSKKTTITCIKGSSTRKISAINPICPKGFTKK